MGGNGNVNIHPDRLWLFSVRNTAAWRRTQYWIDLSLRGAGADVQIVVSGGGDRHDAVVAVVPRALVHVHQVERHRVNRCRTRVRNRRPVKPHADLRAGGQGIHAPSELGPQQVPERPFGASKGKGSPYSIPSVWFRS